MSIESYFAQLREKPEHIRRRYAFWVPLGVTAAISLFWLSSFSVLSLYSKETVAKSLDRAGTPAQSLVASVGTLFVDIRDLIFGSKKVTYPSIEVKPGKR